MTTNPTMENAVIAVSTKLNPETVLPRWVDAVEDDEDGPGYDGHYEAAEYIGCAFVRNGVCVGYYYECPTYGLRVSDDGGLVYENTLVVATGVTFAEIRHMLEIVFAGYEPETIIEI